MDKYAELRSALDQTCHALLIDDPDTIRALLAERDTFADALLAIEGMYEYDMPVGEAAMALYEASNIARALLARYGQSAGLSSAPSQENGT